MKITDNLYHNLVYDWDAHVNLLHCKELFDTPNTYSREVRNMVVYECVVVALDVLEKAKTRIAKSRKTFGVTSKDGSTGALMKRDVVKILDAIRDVIKKEITEQKK